jgi:DNA-binding CsgD family transcriptional regulator
VLRTVLRQAADLTPAGPARGRRLARAAHRSAEVTGDLRAVHRLLADARRADPQADTCLPWVTAAAAKQLHGDGDIDTSHRMLLEALESSLLDGPVDSDIDGPLDDDVVDALHLLLVACAAGGRDELWAPVLRLLERCRPRLPDTLQVSDAAVDGLTDERDPRRIVRVATAAFDLDRGTGCGDALWRVVRDGRSGGAVASTINALRVLALDAYQEGRWTAAEDLATEALEACADRGLPLLAAPARWCLALVAAARGDDDAVRALTDELTAWGVPRGARRLVVYAGQARALAALGRGDFDDAWREATAVGPPGLREPRGPTLWATLDLVEAATRTRRFPEARTHVAAVRAALTPAHSPRLALLAAGATAMAASDDRAGALYEVAFALPDAQRWPFDLARLRLAHGEQLRRARSTTAAREQLLLALDTFTDLGARPWIARASTELRAAGHATDRGSGGPRRAGQAALTAQEREVAGLAASGMTNRQIADRLHLSRRTVDAHLYRVFPKLDITGRAALRDALDRLGDRQASAGQDTDAPPEPAAQPGSPRSDVTPPRSTP